MASVGFSSTLPLNTSFHFVCHAKLMIETFELAVAQVFCKQICSLISYSNMLQLNFVFQDFLSDKVVMHLHMLSSCMKNWILCQTYCRQIIAIQRNRILYWFMQVF